MIITCFNYLWKYTHLLFFLLSLHLFRWIVLFVVLQVSPLIVVFFYLFSSLCCFLCFHLLSLDLFGKTKTIYSNDLCFLIWNNKYFWKRKIPFHCFVFRCSLWSWVRCHLQSLLLPLQLLLLSPPLFGSVWQKKNNIYSNDFYFLIWKNTFLKKKDTFSLFCFSLFTLVLGSLSSFTSSVWICLAKQKPFILMIYVSSFETTNIFENEKYLFIVLFFVVHFGPGFAVIYNLFFSLCSYFCFHLLSLDLFGKKKTTFILMIFISLFERIHFWKRKIPFHCFVFRCSLWSWVRCLLSPPLFGSVWQNNNIYLNDFFSYKKENIFGKRKIHQ